MKCGSDRKFLPPSLIHVELCKETLRLRDRMINQAREQIKTDLKAAEVVTGGFYIEQNTGGFFYFPGHVHNRSTPITWGWTNGLALNLN